LVDLGIPWHLLFDSSSAQQARCNTGRTVADPAATLRKNPLSRRDSAPLRDHSAALQPARSLLRPRVSAGVFLILSLSLIHADRKIAALAQPWQGKLRLMA
jgi:hypothetical protein